ncbi:MAG: lipoyl(octanoyl) transferase LipB [Moraxellaceae bacterium]|nr:lipoyl(octanoyl) transferase LipB [Moraxellaceae bacterium]MDP1776163.1 lipoyl(octanoyl) transferase LipB [Moraxellaceae bacterium]
MSLPVNVKSLAQVDYEPTWQAMRDFTDNRSADTTDELWLLQHPPVYTQGQAGKPEHLLLTKDIPVIQSDRGGQVTYHGPGQLVGYPLFDLSRLNLGPRAFVEAVEDALVIALQQLGINSAVANRDAHGVYIDGRKIASIGLRLRKGCSYHGFSLNVDMDLSPFSGINPCGYAGLSMCQVVDFVAANDQLMARAEQACLYGLQQTLPNLDFGLKPTH